MMLDSVRPPATTPAIRTSRGDGAPSGTGPAGGGLTVARLSAALEAACAAVPVPGYSAALLRGGEPAGVLTGGHRTPGESVVPDTRFQVGSVSKHASTVAVLRLVDQGVLDLDRAVGDYLTGWRLPDAGGPPVTLRHLLSHTSGLPAVRYLGRPPDVPMPTLDDVLYGRPPADTPPVAPAGPPGEFVYSNAGFSVVERVLVDVSGEPFERLMRRLVFGPVGMTSCGYRPDDRDAASHDRSGTVLPGVRRQFSERGSVGLWVTPTDVARLQSALYAAVAGTPAPLLEPASARAMITPVTDGYGLGCMVLEESGRPWYGHVGGTPGSGVFLATEMRSGDGFVVMANSDAGWEFIAAVLSELGPAGPVG